MDTSNSAPSVRLRPSIKSKKNRNPLADVDLEESDKARRSSLRRVSFAKISVKEFAIDPEKIGTVWNMTYEETLNKSDSTPSSQAASTTAESKKLSINFNEVGGEDIVSDSSLCCTDCIVEGKSLNEISMSYPTEEVNKENIVAHHTRSKTRKFAPGTAEVLDVTKWIDQTMEFTEVLHSSDSLQRNKSIVEDATMEFTEEFENEIIVQPTWGKTILNETEMEFTTNIASKFCSKSKSPLNVQCKKGYQESQIEITRLDNSEMEFTQPLAIPSDLPNRSKDGTVCLEEDMEFTGTAVAAPLLTVNSIRCEEDLAKNTKVNRRVLRVRCKKLNDKKLKAHSTVSTVITTEISPTNSLQEFVRQEYLMKQESFVKTGSPIISPKKTPLKCGTLKSCLKKTTPHKDVQQDEEITNLVLLGANSTAIHMHTPKFKQDGPPSETPKIKSGIFTVTPRPKTEKVPDNNKSSAAELKQSSSHSATKTPTSYQSLCVDDTQHLINYSLSTKTPKSELSKIIAGDLNPKLVNSKFMALSEFDSDVFPVSLESSREYSTPHKTVSGNPSRRSKLGRKNFCCTTFTKSAAGVESAADDNAEKSIKIAEGVDECGKKVVKGTSVSENSEVVTGQIDNNVNKDEISERIIEDSCKIIDNLTKPTECCGSGSANSEIKRDSVHGEPALGKLLESSHQPNKTSAWQSSTINISQETLPLSDSMSSESFTRNAEEVIVNITHSLSAKKSSAKIDKYRKVFKERSELQRVTVERFQSRLEGRWARLIDSAAALRDCYQEELRLLNRPFELPFFEEHCLSASNNLTDSSLSMSLSESNSTKPFQMDSTEDVEPVSLTLTQKIHQKLKQCQNYCDRTGVDKDECYISFNKLHVRFEFDEHGIVNNIQFQDELSDIPQPRPLLLFVQKIFRDLLSQKTIEAAVGKHYDILTLIDYVYLSIRKVMDFMLDVHRFMLLYNFQLDKQFQAKFVIALLPLSSTWEISVDLSDIDNVVEDCVKACALCGTVKEDQVKALAKGCPPGLPFLSNFISSIEGYVELLLKRRRFIIN